MVQVPVETMVAVVLETVQTALVVDVKLTARLEVAVALRLNDPVENGYDVTVGANVMVCEFDAMV
jgi:hypothetical protein